MYNMCIYYKDNIISFPGGSSVKNLLVMQKQILSSGWEDTLKKEMATHSSTFAWEIPQAGSILRLGRYPEEGNGNTLQYSCLGNPIDRGGWWATAHGVAKVSDTT